jgi:hypothetical protein
MIRLNAPTQPVFVASVVIAILAVIGIFVTIPVVSGYAFWVLVFAYVILAASCVVKGM